IDAELHFLYPRISGFKAFQEARSLGKRIILLSDMYLPQAILETALQKNGFFGYEKLYVSSHWKAKKHSGALFDCMLQEMGVEPASILHVGDNLDADVKRAKEKGLKAFHLTKASDAFAKSSAYALPWLRDEQRHNLDWTMILAIIGNRFHANPYLPDRKGTLFGGDSWRLGYSAFGPLLLGLAKWIAQSSIRDGVGRLFFLARDGQIMKEAYDLIAPQFPGAPPSTYLLCSRRAVNMAKVRSLVDIYELLNVDFAKTTVGHLLTHRFGLTVTDVTSSVLDQHGLSWSSIVTAADRPRMKQLLADIAPTILDVAEVERIAYMQYLDDQGFWSADEAAVVDIGYAGTMQESLYQLGGHEKKIGGYYLMTFRPALERLESNGLKSSALLGQFVDRHDTHHPFCKNVPLYETLFSSRNTSLVRMKLDSAGRVSPVFMTQAETELAREALVTRVHDGGRAFVAESVKILGKYLRRLDIEPNKSIRMLDQFFDAPHPRDARIFAGVMFEDAYGGGGQKTILPDISNLNRACVWQKGLAVLLDDAKRTGPSPASTSMSQAAPVVLAGSLLALRKPVPALVQPLMRGAIEWTWSRVLRGRKRLKFVRSPELFFHDAKGPFTRSVGRLYGNRQTAR
ncbi:MAG: hypothetical protein JWQ11_1885, partial [Rhizobacter sp.]|nr:hypothetical protein [Rhizobacter sp.]